MAGPSTFHWVENFCDSGSARFPSVDDWPGFAKILNMRAFWRIVCRQLSNGPMTDGRKIQTQRQQAKPPVRRQPIFIMFKPVVS